MWYYEFLFSDLSYWMFHDRLTQTYTLNVRDDISNKTYRLKFPGTHTILDVKTNVYSLIDVPVRKQQWNGWPSTIKDDKITMAQSGISYPEHELLVSELPIKRNKKVYFWEETNIGSYSYKIFS